MAVAFVHIHWRRRGLAAAAARQLTPRLPAVLVLLLMPLLSTVQAVGLLLLLLRRRLRLRFGWLRRRRLLLHSLPRVLVTGVPECVVQIVAAQPAGTRRGSARRQPVKSAESCLHAATFCRKV